jgi:hypothetical protein
MSGSPHVLNVLGTAKSISESLTQLLSGNPPTGSAQSPPGPGSSNKPGTKRAV